jgi:hypothetical protein
LGVRQNESIHQKLESHQAFEGNPVSQQTLEQDDLSSNRHPALTYCLSTILSENRYPLFGIML